MNELYLKLREAMVILQDALEGSHSPEELRSLAREMMAAANDYERASDGAECR